MSVNHFEDLIAWQKAQDLAVFVYENFGRIEDWGFRSQILKASVSVSNNIAEGFERNSKKNFGRFLKIAKGSCGEVRSMAIPGRRLQIINTETRDALIVMCSETGRIIGGLITSINNEIKQEITL